MAKHVLPLTLALGLSHLTTAVWAANNAPNTQGHSETISKSGPHNSWVWANDSDGDALTYKVVQQPQFGHIQMDKNTGTFTYISTSSVNYDEFYYQVNDGSNNSNRSVVQLNFDLDKQTSQSENTATATVETQIAGYGEHNTTPVQITEEERNFDLESATNDQFAFYFKWEDSKKTDTSEYQSHINQKRTVTFLNQSVEVLDNSASDALFHDYNILLPENKAWTLEYANRLLNTMRMIPQEKRSSYDSQTLAPSKWEITKEELTNDIKVEVRKEIQNGKTVNVRVVKINEKAFKNATPRLVEIDGVKGRFFSKRLHHAAVNFVTNFGENRAAVEKVLNERFGVSLNADISQLTDGTTNESDNYFQEFLPREKVQLINIFEDMPTGMHKIKGLTHLVRRKNGMDNPLQPSLAAIAWRSGSDRNSAKGGYIEFMEKAFGHNEDDFIHRLIIHEKAHFIYGKMLKEQTRRDWATIGGWYLNPNDSDGWSTSKQTMFVSAYAHTKNPNEDMAESIAYYILNPDKLRSRSPEKFDFIQSRIMKGSQYLSITDQDKTFEVLNLYPDYIYPGKIKNVEIGVVAESDGDKTVNVTIKLHASDDQKESATQTSVRVFSPIGTYKDFWLIPIDRNGNKVTVGTTLTGSFTVDKNAPSGYWRPDQIALNDLNGNERFNGSNDFGWVLNIANDNPDTTPPAYVPNTLKLQVTQDNSTYGKPVNQVVAEWQVIEEVGMADNAACYGSMVHESAKLYSIYQFGNFNVDTNTCRLVYVMPDYMPAGAYRVSEVMMEDKALNQGRFNFHGNEVSPAIRLHSANPDTMAPTLNLNQINVSAVPVNPNKPNGETIVTISYQVADNISGFNYSRVKLRDPQGVTHDFIHQPNNDSRKFFVGNPSVPKAYTKEIHLPAGSVPGTWGVAEIGVYDLAGNYQNHNFTETVLIEPTFNVTNN